MAAMAQRRRPASASADRAGAPLLSKHAAAAAAAASAAPRHHAAQLLGAAPFAVAAAARTFTVPIVCADNVTWKRLALAAAQVSVSSLVVGL